MGKAMGKAMGEPIVEAVDVRRRFGRGADAVLALDVVSVAVLPGEFVSLEGPSGCGKSTLLHLLGALDVPTEGTVRFDGRDLAALSDAERSTFRLRNIGLVLPVVDLLGTLTVWENVAAQELLSGRSLRDGRDRAMELLELVGLAERASAGASRLSTGEAQRVTLARALYSRPKLLVADEPTSFLDSVRAESVLRLLRRLADEGQSIVMATHDARAAAYADRSVRLLDGRVVEE
jgi:putative ABC transport system ATP-binding protein